MELSSKCDFHDSSVDSETVINVKANFVIVDHFEPKTVEEIATLYRLVTNSYLNISIVKDVVS